MQIGYETVRENSTTKVEAPKGKSADLDAAIEKVPETKKQHQGQRRFPARLWSLPEADGSAEAAGDPEG